MSKATDTPSWVEGYAVDAEPVLVTGGSGTLGRQVVAELHRSQVPARVLTRSNQPEPTDGATTWVTGDLGTGAGLREAVTGVQAIIHCATDPAHASAIDVAGTQRLTEALSAHTPTAHLVLVSIVGASANPLKYYQAKVAAETVVTGWAGPHTILRATQFHSLVEQLTHARVGPLGLGLGVRGLRFASVDPAHVAVRAVDVALSDPRETPVEIAGPETLTAREVAVLTARVRGQARPRIVPIPAVGGVLSAFARGSNLPGPTAERGGLTYAEWLAQQGISR
ncbi:SDR family oxidoreductase [Demetria terragena]|uniref:SDR family oxidoreductase n=1 Tax=Demetria terragena TaxID=63959 RepID=UPI00038266F7|nr:NAD(P)H-binding protein [Demetria terragena]